MKKENFNYYFDFSIKNEYYVCNIHDCNSKDTIVIDVMKNNSDEDAVQYLVHSRNELKDKLTEFKFSDEEIQDAIEYINYEELEYAAREYYIKLKNIKTSDDLDIAEVNPTNEIKSKVINSGTFENPKYFIAQFLIPNGTTEYFEFNIETD